MVILLYDGWLYSSYESCSFGQFVCQILGDLLNLVEATGALTVVLGQNLTSDISIQLKFNGLDHIFKTSGSDKNIIIIYDNDVSSRKVALWANQVKVEFIYQA